MSFVAMNAPGSTLHAGELSTYPCDSRVIKTERGLPCLIGDRVGPNYTLKTCFGRVYIHGYCYVMQGCTPRQTRDKMREEKGR